MNMQALMMQAKKMQRDIEKTQNELESKTYEGKSQFVTAIVGGNNKIISIKINTNDITLDDKELLEDMILIAVNNAIENMEKISKKNLVNIVICLMVWCNMYPNSIKNIIECFKDLPGIGEKTAERLAFSIIAFDKDKLTSFSNAILDIRDKLTTCSVCGNISEKDICNICSDSNRNNKIIFVVEKAKDISLFEKINVYNGKYHVLGGLISPLEGIGPDDVNISSLISRIDTENVEEIILALKPSIEGETTMQYIKKIFEDRNIRITRIATGIPIGTDIDYIDAMTLEFALEGRKDI